ncbi:DUF6414 family protein [Xylella fastidiosa]|uniref:DUF6414 family protein n=1 Tax=Xylella fastidiosa TaxID=2371 RepID=UPI000765ECE3|nr:hypothetical protein [Xylella fastidiosa]KXB20946.1 hypothetical protein ADT30_05540 [Xylella fastidiosa]
MEPKKEAENSVFDYLYVDKEKLSYILSQLNDDGVVTVLRKISALSGSNGGDIKGSLKIVSASAHETESFSDSTDSTFDAKWLLPSNLLAILDDHKLINRGISNATGKIVLVKGKLQIFDLDLIKRLWDGILFIHNSEEKNNQKSKQVKTSANEMKGVGLILKELPPTIQLSLFNNDIEIWSLLDQKYMMVDHYAFALKHGSKIQGEWHVLAIVDSLPGEAEMGALPTASAFINMITPFMSAIKDFMGKPLNAYGVTPLMIFRECH